MPPPKIDLESYKDEISTLFQQQCTTDAIVARLKQRHSIDISHRTPTRRLNVWGIRRLPAKAVDNPDLSKRIRELVLDGPHDKDIVPMLHHEACPKISQPTVARTRLHLGLRLRVHGPIAQAIQEEEIEEVLHQEIQRGHIEGYGKVTLYSHLRERGYLCAR
jgi:hypothetical protein